MAADVLLGNDRDAARWIRTHRVAPPDGEAGGRRMNRRRTAPSAAADRRTEAVTRPTADARPRAEPLVIFTPVGPARPVRDRDDGPRRGPGARRRHRLGLRRARDLRPLPGRAERRRVRRSTGSTSTPDHLTPARPGRGGLPRARRASPPGRRLGCTAHVRGDVVIDVPPESQVYRQVVRKGLDAPRASSRPGRPPPLRRGRAARARLADRRPRSGSRRRSSASGASTDLEADLGVDPRAPAGAREGQLRA